MEEPRSSIDLNSRLVAVNHSAIGVAPQVTFNLAVAGIVVAVGFDPEWGAETINFAKEYWQDFLVTPTQQANVSIVLSPAVGAYREPENEIWNTHQPLLEKIQDQSGLWILHRDFSALQEQGRLHAWIPRPSREITDALDNLIALAVHPVAESRQSVLFHSSIIEHEERAVILFGPSGIGKSTVSKLSSDFGFRVMASDHGYLRIENQKLIASPALTRNPDIPRTKEKWATRPLEVKTILALRRTGNFEVGEIGRAEMTRRIFTEIFTEESGADHRATLKFATEVVLLSGLRLGSLSYPKGFNFWPELKRLGYV